MSRFNLASLAWIFMPVVLIGLGNGIMLASVFLVKHTEGLLECYFGDSQKIQIEYLRERAHQLSNANLSIHNVAEIIGSSLEDELPSFHAIKTKVAPSLFLAFNTIPFVSQISYVNINGVIFSYLYEKDQTHAIFSNTSSKSFNSTFYQWYTEKVDNHTGKGYEYALAIPPIQSNDSLWFSDALKGRSRGPSYGYGWENHRHEMLFFTASVDKFSVVALGIKLKDFINYMFFANLYGLRVYVFTKDDIFMVKSTNTLKAINMSDILPLKGIFSDSCNGVIDSQLFSYSSSTKQLITKLRTSMIYCAPIQIAEIHLAIIIEFPVKNFMLLLQEMKIIIILLMSFCIIFIIIYGCISSMIFRGLQKDKFVALTNLIKQKEATQQAERKSMNKSIAFSSASHDVRASLAGITGLINLCLVDVPQTSDLARNLTKMNSCASKLLGILNSVLDISKVEAGKMQLEDVEFNMAQAIEESVDIFHAVALAKGLEVIWDPCDFSVLMSSNVRGDCRRFKQILDNLLSNAIKFTSEGYVIVRAWAKKVGSKNSDLPSIQQENFLNIWTYLSRWFCCIGCAYPNNLPVTSIYNGQGDVEFIFEVDDTGTGIPKDRRKIIFENYVQLKEPILGCEGTGLGLGIVQSYVRLMGGDIVIKEKHPGKNGSCFMFNIFLTSKDISSNNDDEDFETCKIPILNRLHPFSSKTGAKVQLNNGAITVSPDVNVDGLMCLLAIHNSETRRILKDWLKSIGIMVRVALQPENMNVVLKRMTRNNSASESCDLSLSSSGVNSEYSSPNDENKQVLPISLKDVSKKASLKSSHKHLLFIVDLGFGNFSQMQNFLSFLAKDSHDLYQYKVICLTDSTVSCSQLPCDLILHKPLHGSRFYKIIELIHEFRQTNVTLKSGVAQESNSSNELETKNLLNSAYSQQYSSLALKNENENEPLSGMKILLVEDTILFRQIALKELSRSGAIVRSANDGLEALNIIKKALKETSHTSQGSCKHLPFDFILMDCQMPVMNGYEATQCIRVEEKKYDIHIPIFALSAHTELEEVKKSLLCGMDFHLTKPIKISELLEAIKLFPK